MFSTFEHVLLLLPGFVVHWTGGVVAEARLRSGVMHVRQTRATSGSRVDGKLKMAVVKICRGRK